MNVPRTPPPKATQIEYPYTPELFTYTPNRYTLPSTYPSPSPSPSPINNERIEPSQKRFRNIEQENQIKRNYEECIQRKLENTETFIKLQKINLKMFKLEKKKKELKNKLEDEKSKIIEECEEENEKFFNNPIFHSPNSPMSSRNSSSRSRSSRKRSHNNNNNLPSASSPKLKKSKKFVRYTTLPEQQEMQLNVEVQQNMKNPIVNGNINNENFGMDDFDLGRDFVEGEGQIIGAPIYGRNNIINSKYNANKKTKRRRTI
jgi:hypothetical protein